MNYQMKTKDTYMKGRYVNIIDVILWVKDLKKCQNLKHKNGYWETHSEVETSLRNNEPQIKCSIHI